MSRLHSSPALLVVDMQNGFCHPSGSFNKIGLPISRQAMIAPKIEHITSVCRTPGIPTFYTKMEFDGNFSDAGIILDGPPGVKEAEGFVRGSWDAQILDILHPRPVDTVVSKTRHSAFFQTNLSHLLAEKKINQVIVTGVATNVCVESTVRDGYNHGFKSLTVEDATATLIQEEQVASIRNLQHFGGTITMESLEQELNSLSRLLANSEKASSVSINNGNTV
ncbi:Isochorismatase-like hydrolase [Glarea lozoyensis ATCC 20868]|uniref:Isochorismatase-like hydrolase n=1 Tax=Glarea lozoyensis (strain ATCC 20868 / MF5171) TaxID=1116229 RepID=S3CQX8_GLAL2|nr:Isochorismatase-like hydrolase [Glarea lozoyensis ATCC 20868]EPE28837.1 Isochorismatase-like hydrolase [Glarea lozoyensis ATCC 20868]